MATTMSVYKNGVTQRVYSGQAQNLVGTVCSDIIAKSAILKKKFLGLIPGFGVHGHIYINNIIHTAKLMIEARALAISNALHTGFFRVFQGSFCPPPENHPPEL